MSDLLVRTKEGNHRWTAWRPAVVPDKGVLETLFLNPDTMYVTVSFRYGVVNEWKRADA